MCDFATEDINDALIILAETIEKLQSSIDTLTLTLTETKKKLSFLMSEIRKKD